MESNCYIRQLYPNVFPQHASLSSQQQREENTPLFISSIRCLDSRGSNNTAQAELLVYVYNLNTKTRHIIRVGPLNYLAIIPHHLIFSLSPIIEAHQKHLTITPPRLGTFYNGDTKETFKGLAFLFSTESAYFNFTTACNRQHNNASCSYFLSSMYRGNIPVFMSGLLCAHTFFVKGPLKDRYKPHDFIFDAQFDQEVIANRLDDIVANTRREAGFDIETIVGDDNVDPELSCPSFKAHFLAPFKQSSERRQQLLAKIKGKSTPPSGLDSNIACQLKEITSVALVVANAHLPKPPGGHRKELLVYYNASRARAPVERVPAEDVDLDPERVTLIPCQSEFSMLLKFVNKLRESVDVLYVYNADFDVYVIDQRIRFYSYQHTSCCDLHSCAIEVRQSLATKWNQFLSKDPSYAPSIQHTIDTQLSEYNLMLNTVEQTCDLNVQYAAMTRFSLMRPKLQNTRVTGFNTDIIDLYRTTNQFNMPADRKLDTVAKTLIVKHRPGKDVRKTHKLKDLSYSVMDKAFMAGGASLYRYLLYNLVDSQLLLRIARYTKPVHNYIYRMRATLNIDLVSHGRGRMYFTGFVQSTMGVELPLLKSRIDQNTVLSYPTGKGCSIPSCYVNKMAFEGGFVSKPYQGLFYAGPSQTVETNLDFSSLYPSNMYDTNISPEALVGDSPQYLAKYAAGRVVYDWSGVSPGKNAGSPFKLCTILLDVDRTDPSRPKPHKYISYTAHSLRRYLGLRKMHKQLMVKHENNPLLREYHNKQQGEMKVCANSYYGVAPSVCQAMITAQGRHKIVSVNRFLTEYDFESEHRGFSNYGDTDSTMFFLPTDDSDSPPFNDVDDKTPLETLHETVINHIRRKVSAQGVHITRFLAYVRDRLFNDFMERLFYVLPDGSRLPLRQTPQTCPLTNYPVWVLDDPVSGQALNVTAAYGPTVITELVYENASSAGLHLQPKEYICLIHEVDSNSNFIKTSVKRQGLAAKKSTAFGATWDIAHDFETLVIKGGYIEWRPATFESMTCRDWSQIAVGQTILYFNTDPLFDPNGICTNLDSLNLVFCRVNAVREVTGGLHAKDPRTTALVELERPSSGPVTLTVHRTGPYCLNHFFSWANTTWRAKNFQFFCAFRTFFTAAGFTDWTRFVQFCYSEHCKPEFLEKLKQDGIVCDKGGKTPYVTLIKEAKVWKETLKVPGTICSRPPAWEKQDPTVAFFKLYPFDVRSDVLFRDYFGNAKRVNPAEWLEPHEATHHHVVLKKHVENQLVNDRGKFLTHTVVENRMFKTQFKPSGCDLARMVELIRGDLQAVWNLINDRLREGKGVFLSVCNNVPRELQTVELADNAITNYYKKIPKITSTSLTTTTANVALPRDYYGTDVSQLRREAVSRCSDLLRAHSDLVRVSFVKDVAASAAPLAALDEHMTSILGLSDDPGSAAWLYRETKNTADKNLAQIAQSLYQAELMKQRAHAPLNLTADLGLCAPPLVANRQQLCEWIRQSKTVKPTKMHCAGCQEFWTHLNPKRFLSLEYDVDPNTQLYVRKRKYICLLEVANNVANKKFKH
uniref:DNA-directed DNA polymerase n=1 Tax=Lake sturgeon herpesvirus TaxID=2922427 RepID=A0A9E9JWC6_9VIRU|nr:DNA polymerase catalytic subunit [Lake sturgeon herpesvirus]